MNTYIQNKLDEFDERFGIKRNHAYFSPENDDESCANNSNKVRMFIEQSLTDYHNHIVEKVKKGIDNWKDEIGEIPENTCPKIDKIIGQHKEILDDLNYLEKNKHKYETVDDIVKDLPGTYWDNVESIAEELRASNEKLREIGKFWYENCKSIPSLLQDTNQNE